MTDAYFPRGGEFPSPMAAAGGGSTAVGRGFETHVEARKRESDGSLEDGASPSIMNDRGTADAGRNAAHAPSALEFGILGGRVLDDALFLEPISFASTQLRHPCTAVGGELPPLSLSG